MTPGVTEIDHFNFRDANSSRCDAPRLLSANPGKHRLSCNPEKRVVEFIADGAAASDEIH